MQQANQASQDPITEAQERIGRLLPVKHKLRDNQAQFVGQLDAKLKQYGQETYISQPQLDWLRILDEKYSPDERQGQLF
jgi:hypothetical protein